MLQCTSYSPEPPGITPIYNVAVARKDLGSVHLIVYLASFFYSIQQNRLLGDSVKLSTGLKSTLYNTPIYSLDERRYVVGFFDAVVSNKCMLPHVHNK